MKLVLVEFFEIKKSIMSTLEGADEFIELDLDGHRVAILCVLD